MALTGILGAHLAEVNPIVNALAAREVSMGMGKRFALGTISGHSLVVTTSGVGKARTAARCQFLLDNYNIARIIFTGVAGALNPDLKPGDTIVSRYIIEHDFKLGVDADQTLFQSDCAEHSISRPIYEADPMLIEAALAAGERLGGEGRICAGTILSGDEAILQHSRKQQLRQAFGGDCVEMEGAAMAAVCQLNSTSATKRIPFVAIRTMSDMADEDAADTFNHWFRQAAERSASLVIEMLKEFPKPSIA